MKIHEGGTVAGNAKREIESKTGRKIVTSKNARGLKLIEKKQGVNGPE